MGLSRYLRMIPSNLETSVLSPKWISLVLFERTTGLNLGEVLM